MAKKPTYEELEQLVKKLQKETAQRRNAEKALRESEEIHRALVENAGSSIDYFDTEGKVILTNSNVVRDLGLEKEELVGKSIFELFPDQGELFWKRLRKAIDERVGFEFEDLVGLPEGKRWFISHIQPVEDSQGRVAGVLSISTDITDRKLAEEALIEREERYRMIVENSIFPIIYYTLDGKVQLLNTIAAKNMNGKPDDFIGKSLYELHPAVAEKTMERIRRIMETGEGDEFEDSFELPAAGLHWFLTSMQPVKNSKNEITAIQMIAVDITERKKTEESLCKSEERLELILETISDGVWDWDIAGNNVYTSLRFRKLLGIKEPNKDISFSFNDWALRLHPDHHDRVMNALQKHLDGKAPFDVEYLLRDDAGQYRWQNARGRAFFNQNGQAYRMVGSIHDIHDAKIAEQEKEKLNLQLQQAQKMEAIGTLAGGVAHDLNNVLSGIVSYPDLLLMQLPEDSPLRKPILTIQETGKKAAAIVQDLLTLARRGVPISEVINLNAIVREYLNSPEYKKLKMYHPGIELRVNLEADLLNILGSPVHLNNTVMNLTSNAVEAMPVGGTLSISTENKYIDSPIKGYDYIDEGDYVVLMVSDTGTGISSEDINRIFEPFYTKKKMGKSGTGLGMALVWGTVKDHDGYIEIRSTVEEGTTFTLYFPVTRQELENGKAGITVDIYRGNGETVLIVDDVQEQREIASSMLSELGYSVFEVSCGEEAIEFLKKKSVDLLLLDMIMYPGMDGLDTYKQILKQHPAQKAIIASGFSETDRVKEAQRLGAGQYLKKPYTLNKLSQTIRNELKKG